MANTPLLAFLLLATDSLKKEQTVNEFMVYSEAIMAGHVLSATTSAPPGSPATGDFYIIGGSATGVWTGEDDNLAYYYNGWQVKTPTEGLEFTVADASNQKLRWDGTAWIDATESRDINFAKITGIPTSSEVLHREVVTRLIEFPADFAGSAGDIQTNPTSTFDIDVQDDTVSIGTISISTGGAFTFTTVSNTAKTVAAGSLLEFIAPGSADASAAGITVGLQGFPF